MRKFTYFLPYANFRRYLHVNNIRIDKFHNFKIDKEYFITVEIHR